MIANKKLLNKWIITCVVFSIAIFYYLYNSHNSKYEAIFGTIQIPYSSDPLEFDSYTHHYAFSSVLAKLVSTEKSGEIYPMLASAWMHDNHFQDWSFKLRTDLVYSNGEMITPGHILKSLKRVAFLQKKNNSNSGLMEFLEGYSSFGDLGVEISGLYLENDILKMKFTKPMPNLLETISFGFYSLAHPNLYDHVTGAWLNKKGIIASGQYKVDIWNDNNYEISFRDDAKFIDPAKRIKKIKFTLIKNVKNSNELSKIDFLVADKKSLMVDNSFKFVGSVNNLKIGYARCYAWDKKNSPFNDVLVRRWFRSKFYLGLTKNGFQTTNSFFPQTLQGLKEIVPGNVNIKPEFKPFKLITHPMGISGKIKENENKVSIAEYFRFALDELGIESGAQVEFQDLPKDDMYDLAITGTGIESTDYLETVRFMFLSKDGIRLPDSTGVIKKELSKEKPNINIINQELWDQAIIWPIRHYSSGYWFNSKSSINFSELNFESPSIDFSFLKWN